MTDYLKTRGDCIRMLEALTQSPQHGVYAGKSLHNKFSGMAAELSEMYLARVLIRLHELSFEDEAENKENDS